MTTQSPLYRLATQEDLEQLIELRVLMQEEVNAPRKADSNYTGALARYFEQGLRDESYVSAVAEIDRKLVSANGMILYRKPPSVLGGTGLTGYISNVYTRPEWRARGIAGELMKILIKQARLKGVDKLHLGTTESGKGVYERVGFEPPRFPSLELKL